MATSKTKKAIKLLNWTTIQQQAAGTNQLGDNEPQDDLGGPGPYLVFENGIWKFPQQDSCGRFSVGSNAARLIYMMADLGADADWELHVAGIDNTTDRPDNESGEPYDAGDASLYREGDIVVASGTAERYVSLQLMETCIVQSNQDVYVSTTSASEPLVRLTFSPLYDSKRG